MLHPDNLFEVGNILEKFRTYAKDELGLPITDPNGQPISQKNRKYVEKIYNNQKELYDKSNRI